MKKYLIKNIFDQNVIGNFLEKKKTISDQKALNKISLIHSIDGQEVIGKRFGSLVRGPCFFQNF